MSIFKKISCLTLFLFIPIYFFASGIGYTGKYIPIHLLTQKDCSRFINLDIKTKKLNLNIENQTRTFIQENSIDSTKIFKEQSLICRLKEEYILLKIVELKQVESDSIYISAEYQKFNKQGNIGKEVKIKNLAINKTELSGVFLSPPIKEVKKMGNKYFWFAGTFAVLITTLAIIIAK